MMDIGLLTASKYNDGGALEAQVLLHGPGSSCTPGLAYSPFGFKGRPRGPKVDAAGNIQDGALVLYWYEGNALHTLPLDDGRRSTTLPQLAEGGSIFYADVVDGAGNQLDAYAMFDASGKLKIVVPSGQKVQVGASPVSLAKNQAIADLQAAIKGWTPVSQDGGAALKTALATWLATQYGTQTLEAT